MNYKQLAALKALDYIEDGMVIGLGSGSTTACFVEALGERWCAGVFHQIQAVSTSLATTRLAQAYGIPLTSLADHDQLDLAFDGADEVDPALNLIKGLGLALLREKIVEVHARRLIIMVDESKLVKRLGNRGPLPVEILPYEWQAHVRWLERLGCQVEMRVNPDGSHVLTDNGNYIALCWFYQASSDPAVHSTTLVGIEDPYALARKLADWPGVIEHGLFLDLASLVVVAGVQGVQLLERGGRGLP